jgi:RHS repeat-associated protein
MPNKTHRALPRYKISDFFRSLLGVLTAVTQNAQATSGQQTRSYSYDANGRLTSESNPESGTTTYVYDVNGGCGASAGDLTKKTDANGINTCVGYDALHRVVSTQFSNSTNCKFYRYDSNPGVGWTEGNVKGRLSNAWIGNCSTGNPTASDDGFNYSARGELINIYHTTVSSGIWYNSTASYWPNGAPNTLQLFTCITNCTNTTNNTAVTPLITYNADGEGRPSTVSASSGQNPVTATTFNAASLPTAVTYGSADTDALTYDPNTFRMTKYQFNVNGQAYVGALTWNADGSLGSQVITDPFNSADAQTCSYSHEDLSRIAKVDCGATKWQQNFTYDAFGNITKTVPVGGTGNSFQPTYSATTNRFTSLPGFTPTYDADGNVTADGSHTYSWDANGNSTIVDGVGLTFDAADRMVEQNRSGTLTEVIYAPTGQKFALMNGTTLKKAFIALPGNATAIYTSAGLDHYWHTDWLGSARLAASPTRVVLSTVAYAPFGETYTSSGTPDLSFTGQDPDTTSGDYDFLSREYSNEGRWASPDPAGLAAVDPTTPQSWNRYAYVENDPCEFTDPLGQTPSCTLNIGVYASQLSQTQLRALQGALAAIFNTADVGVNFNFSGAADFSLSVVPSGTPAAWGPGGPVQAPQTAGGSDQGQDPSTNIAGLNHGIAFFDRAFSFYGLSPTSSRVGSVLGRIGAHEAGHYLLNMLHNSPVLSGSGGIMDAGNNFLNPNLAFTPGQAIQLQARCQKLRNNGGGGGIAGGGFVLFPPSGLSEGGWTPGGFYGWVFNPGSTTAGKKPL